ncbi:SprB repeat-containing protein, partial [Hymenobacter sp. BT770]|uniref:SprB repeat-containing protein n=1 Tax=Hymenobacter sp. BT770 TaxID=2886942 RepID=UPI001D125FB6
QPVAPLGVTLSTLVQATCTSATGSATLAATGGTGPYTYSLQLGTNAPIVLSGAGAVTFPNLAAGIYQVLVVDANRCQATCAAIEIRGVNTITGLLAAVGTNVSCFGGNNGTANVTVAGGTAPFTFRLDGLAPIVSNSRTVSFTGLVAGVNIPVSVSDANGCTSATTVTI